MPTVSTPGRTPAAPLENPRLRGGAGPWGTGGPESAVALGTHGAPPYRLWVPVAALGERGASKGPGWLVSSGRVAGRSAKALSLPARRRSPERGASWSAAAAAVAAAATAAAAAASAFLDRSPSPSCPAPSPPRVRPPSSSARRPRPPRARPSFPSPRPAPLLLLSRPATQEGVPQLLSTSSHCAPRRPVIQRPPPSPHPHSHPHPLLSTSRSLTRLPNSLCQPPSSYSLLARPSIPPPPPPSPPAGLSVDFSPLSVSHTFYLKALNK